MKNWHWFCLSLLIVVLDQSSKYWADLVLTPYEPVPLLPMLNVMLAFNTGAAFSFLNGAGDWHHGFFVVFSLVMSGLLSVWLWRTPRHAYWVLVGLSCILGGAVGNLLDRVFYGSVLDFIDVYYQHYHFATFNVADSAITLGASFLMVDLLRQRQLTRS